MNSWDCFDTLVARRFVHPHTIFDEVGKRLNIENFTNLRKRAEDASDKSYQGIYKNLTNIDPSIEFGVELEHCFGITENMNKVQNGDIIVSDMYLNEDQIRQILISCGLDKDVKIYVTPNGKSSGNIWKTLPKIDLHTGDNHRSDIESSNRFGIKSSLYTDWALNDIEQLVYHQDQHLACWMRYVRLRCPYLNEQKTLWEDQSNFNLPVLALASLELPDKMIAFNFRDCVFWKPLYEEITGKISKRVDTSRLCYADASVEFSKYLLNEISGCVLVDLQGTGRSPKNFFKYPQEIIYICGDVVQPFFSISGKISDCIEKHNCSSEGTLIEWNERGPIRKDCEHSNTIVEVQQNAMLCAIESAKYFNIKKNKSLLIDILHKMKGNYTSKTVPWIHTHVR